MEEDEVSVGRNERQAACAGRGQHSHHTESVNNVVLQKSTPPQIRQLILHHH